MNDERIHMRLLTWFVGILTVFAVISVAKLLSELILPVFVSLLVARFLRPYVTKLCKRGIPHGVSILLVTLVCVGVFTSIGLLLTYCGTQVAHVIPTYAHQISTSFDGLVATLKGLTGHAKVGSMATEPTSVLPAERIVSIVSGALSATVAAVSNSFMIFILVLMILGAGDSFNNAILAAYGPDKHKRIVDVVHATDDSMRQFLVSKSLVNVLSGLMVGLVALAFGVDLALVFGVLTFFLTFVPAIGGLVALALPIGMAFLQYGSSTTATGVVVCLLVGNMIIERIVEPKVMGKSLDLSPVVVILAFLFFTWLWGAIGALLAVPVTAMVKVFCEAVPKLRPVAILLREN